MGTRFETMACLTEDPMTAAAKRSEGNRDTFEDFQRAFLAGAGSNEPSTPMGSARSQ